MGFYINGIFQAQTEPGGAWNDVVIESDYDRNALLFAWLAGVRNYFEIVPLSNPRGLPESFVVIEGRHPIESNAFRGPFFAQYHAQTDMQVADYTLWMRMGEHSHSWLDADEILTAPDQWFEDETVMDLGNYDLWDGISTPKTTEDKVYTAFLPEEIGPDTKHVQVKYQRSLLEALSSFIAEVRRKRDCHGKVRFVFGFEG